MQVEIQKNRLEIIGPKIFNHGLEDKVFARNGEFGRFQSRSERHDD